MNDPHYLPLTEINFSHNMDHLTGHFQSFLFLAFERNQHFEALFFSTVVFTARPPREL